MSTVVYAGAGSVLVGGFKGGSVLLRQRLWTLAEKAAHYQGMIRPRHDRYGYVAACGLRQAGTLSRFVLHDSDNVTLFFFLPGGEPLEFRAP